MAAAEALVPGALAAQPGVLFRLQCQQFLELVRRVLAGVRAMAVCESEVKQVAWLSLGPGLLRSGVVFAADKHKYRANVLFCFSAACLLSCQQQG